jgi:hypothetical protein
MYKPFQAFTKFVPYILFFSEFLYFAYIHSWEVDPHHDGIMYTAAVGFFEGKVPNKDFFAQYGPITPVIQGLWFRIMEPTVWNLKLLTSLGLALIGTFVYIGVKRRLSILTAALLSICWVLSGPFGLPWSSVFAIIFISASLLLLESILSSRFRRNNVYLAFAIGVMLALGTYTRIQTALVFLAASLGLLLVKNRIQYLRVTFWLNLGFFFTFGSITFVLAKSHALKPYLDQCIVWASGRYAGGPEISLSFFVNLAWIPFFGMFNLLIIRMILRFKSSRSLQVRFIILGTFLFYIMLLIFSQWPRHGAQTLRNPRVLEIIGGQKAQFAFNFSVLTLFLLLTLQVVYFWVKKAGPGKFVGSESQIIYFLVAGATATQLYPYPDEYHIAFVVPVIILASVFIFPKNSNLSPNQNAFYCVALALIPSLLIHFLLLAHIDRYEFESKTLTGMYGSWQSAKSLDSTMVALENELPGIRFNCADGIYAGAGGRYLSLDEKFVTWGPPPRTAKDFDREFLCYADNQIINSYLSLGWNVKFKVLWHPVTGYSDISYWNILFEKPELDATKGELS